MAGALLTIPISAILKFLPVWTGGFFPDYPFLDRMTITFFIIAALMIAISLLRPARQDNNTIKVDKRWFKVSTEFVIGSVFICGVLVALYTVFW
ncbi:hypothetical protein [Niabella hibiscisoli]|uniref:hypothetical protein n=1 Tax=Niabella hibiscisoli TaxID=1825928 RepID=UPI00293EB7FE|nr:hypothetical protein [Niabella hibiscisoli]